MSTLVKITDWLPLVFFGWMLFNSISVRWLPVWRGGNTLAMGLPEHRSRWLVWVSFLWILATPMLWRNLAPLGLSILCMGLTALVNLYQPNEIRSEGIVAAGGLLRWKKFNSFRWTSPTTLHLKTRYRTVMTIEFPEELHDEIDAILRAEIPAEGDAPAPTRSDQGAEGQQP